MARCTGGATSTFGGGGATKLFCSQALKLTKADMTKAERVSGAFRSRTKLLRMKCADARACLISEPQFK
jgi:ABC-type uncharacterized transport system YnjBCD ATPase subunit